MVISESAKGSSFSVRLLLAALSLAEQKEREGKQPFLPVPPPSPVEATSRRILVVEDNVINQKLVVRILEKAGHRCQVADDGVKAVWAHEHGEFDLILMDIQMPNMDGVTATRIIRLRESDNGLPRTPIIALTANALESDFDEGYEAGIDMYLTKPFKKEDILQRVADLPHAARSMSGRPM